MLSFPSRKFKILFNKQLEVMAQTVERTETAYEFLQRKGIRKVHQLNKRYNLTIGELVEFLNEYAENTIHGYHNSGYADNSFDYRYNVSESVF